MLLIFIDTISFEPNVADDETQVQSFENKCISLWKWSTL